MLTLIQPMNGLCYHVFKLMIFLFKNNLLVIFKFSRRKTLIVTNNTAVDPNKTGDKALLSTFGTYNTASSKNVLDALQCNF